MPSRGCLPVIETSIVTDGSEIIPPDPETRDAGDKEKPTDPESSGFISSNSLIEFLSQIIVSNDEL